MNIKELEEEIDIIFKKYKHLSESTNIKDEVRLEKVGNHLEYLLQLKANFIIEE
jgi:hypothetical protein